MIAAALLSTGALATQSYRDLTLVRNRKNEGDNVLQIRAGVGFGFVGSSEDESIGLRDVVAPHGSIYFRRRHFANQNSVLLGYAGFDGAYLTVKDDLAAGGQGQNRLELMTRYYPYYREGFYRDGEFVPTGTYEGNDYGVALATARRVDNEFTIELGLFYRRYGFDRNETTAAGYVIPEDYNGYGIRATLEHDTLVLQRRTGRPERGFLFTITAEREQNDSAGTFGTTGIYESELPSGLWRGRGHLEWYFPHTEVSNFALVVDGTVADEADRVYAYDATKSVGNIVFDGQFRWRIAVGDQLTVTPYVAGQWLRILDEAGFGSDTELFLGAGLDVRWDLGDSFSMFAEYSFMDNENRPTVSPTRDTLGKHQLFTGVEIRF